MRTGGEGVKKSEIFADVLNGSPQAFPSRSPARPAAATKDAAAEAAASTRPPPRDREQKTRLLSRAEGGALRCNVG